MHGVKLTGIGTYLPERVVTNGELAAIMRNRREEVRQAYGLAVNDPTLAQFDTSDEWIFTRTGIRERRWAAADEATSDLAVKAARAALDDSGLRADCVEFILIATVTPDHLASPPTAAIVQEKLGIRVRGETGDVIRDVECFDVAKACCSFLAALSMGDAWIRSGRYKAGLVIGADVMTRIVNRDDRSFFPLMGDGAGCFVLERTSLAEDQFGPNNFLGGADGSLAHLIETPAGGSRTPLTPEGITNPFDRRDTLRMEGKRVFQEMVPLVPPLIKRAVERVGRRVGDIGCLLLHQANERISEAAVRRLEYPVPVWSTIGKCANTTSASLPLGYADAVEHEAIEDGKIVLMVAFGGGITWSTALFTHRS